MENNSTGCCSGACSCNSEIPKKEINIDFLYLDLSVCERCQGTETNLDEAMNEVRAVLNAAGYVVSINKVNITSKELAVKYEFVSSPTIRINGRDISPEVKESNCKDCGDLCGDNVDCRVWSYEDKEYTEPPKALIINAILKEVYAEKTIDSTKKEEYKLPANLEVFFNGKNK